MSLCFKHSVTTNRQLFIPFIMAGDPVPEATVDIALLLQEKGANAIELGIPHSDPLADGPVIQRSAKRALAAGMTMEKALQLAGQMRNKGLNIPIIVFTYYNLLLQLGENRFFSLAEKYNIDGLLVCDLPYEESLALKDRTEQKGLVFISLVAPTTSERRKKMIVENASGFVYCVSSLGVTGARKGEFAPTVYDFLNQVRNVSKIPVVCGFGISERQQIERLAPHCDGVVIGSAIVSMIEKEFEGLRANATRRRSLEKIGAFLDELVGMRVK